MANSLVILHKDPAHVASLLPHVKSVSDTVFAVHSLSELRTLISKCSIQTAVIDLAMVSPEEIIYLQKLGMRIVCTHHFADDSMWAAALAAGALDCCFDDDAPAICRAIRQSAAA